MTGPAAGAVLARLELELDDLRLALEWWLQSNSPESLLLYVASLSRLFAVSARPAEGAAWHARALEQIQPAGVPPRRHVVALIRAASLTEQAGDVPGARALYEQAFDVARTHGDKAGESSALTGLVSVAVAAPGGAIFAMGREPDLLVIQERAVELAWEVGDERELAIGLHRLGELRLASGDVDAAAATLAEAMRIHRTLGDVVNEPVSLLAQANVALHREHLEDAIRWFRDGIDMAERLRSSWLAAAAVEGIAAGLLARGADAADVARLAGASETLFAASGTWERYRDGYFTSFSGDGAPTLRKAITEARARETLDPAEYDRAWAQGRALGPAAAVELAQSLAESALDAATVAVGARSA